MHPITKIFFLFLFDVKSILRLLLTLCMQALNFNINFHICGLRAAVDSSSFRLSSFNLVTFVRKVHLIAVTFCCTQQSSCFYCKHGKIYWCVLGFSMTCVTSPIVIFYSNVPTQRGVFFICNIFYIRLCSDVCVVVNCCGEKVPRWISRSASGAYNITFSLGNFARLSGNVLFWDKKEEKYES